MDTAIIRLKFHPIEIDIIRIWRLTTIRRLSTAVPVNTTEDRRPKLEMCNFIIASRKKKIMYEKQSSLYVNEGEKKSLLKD